jgi:hypothetical protein
LHKIVLTKLQTSVIIALLHGKIFIYHKKGMGGNKAKKEANAFTKKGYYC